MRNKKIIKSAVRENRSDMLANQNILKLILTMAAPAIFGNLSAAMYNIIDRMFVGRFVGREALGAIALLFPLVNITQALSLFMTIGGTAMLSIQLGAKNPEKANKIFSNIVLQGIGTGLLLATVYSTFAPDLVRMCGALPGTELYDLAVSYLRITGIGQMFLMCNMAFTSMIRAEGNIRYAMFASIAGNCMSIILDSILVAGMGMGIRGAGLSTLSAQFISGLISILYFVRKKSVVHWSGFKVVHINFIGRIIMMGMAPSILQGLSFISNTIISRSLMYYGNIELAAGGSLAISAVGVTATVESFLLTVVMGVNQAISPIISYNYGAGSYSRVRKASLYGQLIASIASIFVWGWMMLFPGSLFRIFANHDIELISFGIGAMRTAKCVVFVLGFQTLSSMFFSALGKPKTASFISLSRQGIFLIPALLIFPRLIGVQGVFWASAFSDFCSVLIVGRIYFKEIQRMNKLTDKVSEKTMLAKSLL